MEMLPPPRPGRRVLSIQIDTLGHSIHGRLFRGHCRNLSSDLDVESVWLHEGRSVGLRILGRFLGPCLPGRWAKETNFDLRRSRTEFLLGMMGRRVAESAISRRPVDLLHFHTQVAAYGSNALMKCLPTLITGDMTAAQIARHEGSSKYAWTHRLSVAMDQRAFRTARKVAMWSNWAARSVIEDYGTNAEKVEVVYPGVDTQRLYPLQTLNSSSNSRVKLLFVGGDFVRKGGPELLDLFLKEFAVYAELHLVTNSIVDCNHPAVHVHRHVEAYSERWINLYRSCNIFVLPTQREAFGLALIEAMAMGLPVLSTKVNAIPEIVLHGKSGFLVEPNRINDLAVYLRRLVDDVALRVTMGGHGREVALCKFDADRNFARLTAIMSEMFLPSTAR